MHLSMYEPRSDRKYRESLFNVLEIQVQSLNIGSKERAIELLANPWSSSIA